MFAFVFKPYNARVQHLSGLSSKIGAARMAARWGRGADMELYSLIREYNSLAKVHMYIPW